MEFGQSSQVCQPVCLLVSKTAFVCFEEFHWSYYAREEILIEIIKSNVNFICFDEIVFVYLNQS